MLKEKALKFFGIKDKENNLHAVVGVLIDNNIAYLIFNGYDSNYSKYCFNSFLIHQVIENLSDDCTQFDFEGSMIPGIEKFYRGFGGQLTPYFQIWKSDLIHLLTNQLLSLLKKIIYRKKPQ